MLLLDRRKSTTAVLEENENSPNRLKRSMGGLALTALGVGAIIGTGIFVLTGVAAAKFAGPGVVYSFIIAGIVSALAALCYAEFASTVPVSGSAYTYAYATLGEFFAWIIGWDLILEYAFGSAAVSVGWSGYVVGFLQSAFGIALPKALTASPFAGGVINLPAVLIVLAITALLVRGASETGRVNTIIVAVKLLVVGFFIVVGFGHINAANYQPFLPFGWPGVLGGASIIFFAYIGFDAVSTSAEEAREPARDLPRGILGSLVICTVLYIIVAAILTGIVNYTRLDVAAPVSFALEAVGLHSGAAIVGFGAIAGLTTVLLVNLYAQSRIFFAMSRDRLLPPFFAHIHPKFRTPYLSTVLVGGVVALIGGLTPIEVVAELTSIGTLAAFIIVSAGLLILRRTDPDLPRAFRVPALPLVATISIVGCLVLIAKLPGITIWRFVIWLAIGLIVYYAYGRRNSALAATQDR